MDPLKAGLLSLEISSFCWKSGLPKSPVFILDTCVTNTHSPACVPEPVITDAEQLSGLEDNLKRDGGGGSAKGGALNSVRGLGTLMAHQLPERLLPGPGRGALC